jgi:transcriptional regulator with XRE-family HTH domain
MIRTGAQIRAARAMLGLRREDLATAAGLHPNAVKYWEARDVPPSYLPYAIERALTMLGVIAFADPSPGARLSVVNNFDGP